MQRSEQEPVDLSDSMAGDQATAMDFQTCQNLHDDG